MKKSENKNSNTKYLDVLRLRQEKRRKQKLKILIKRLYMISAIFISLSLVMLGYNSLSGMVVATFNEEDEIMSETTITTDTATPTLPLSGKIIILDPGHDQYTNEYDGYIEGVAMLSLAQQIKPHLENQGATVYLTRDDGDFIELSERASFTNIISLDYLRDVKLTQGYDEFDEIIKEIDYIKSVLEKILSDSDTYASQYLNTPFDEENKISDVMTRLFALQDDDAIQNNLLFISLHTDGLEQEYYDYVGGADVYYISNDMPDDFGSYYENYAHINNNILFADILLDEINAVGMQRSDIIEGNFHVLREVNIPAVLVENGYHTNDDDRAKLENPQFITNLATAYEYAIVEYFNSLQ